MFFVYVSNIELLCLEFLEGLRKTLSMLGLLWDLMSLFGRRWRVSFVITRLMLFCLIGGPCFRGLPFVGLFFFFVRPCILSFFLMQVGLLLKRLQKTCFERLKGHFKRTHNWYNPSSSSWDYGFLLVCFLFLLLYLFLILHCSHFLVTNETDHGQWLGASAGD